jgi:SAM-dependent methyltransferase
MLSDTLNGAFLPTKRNGGLPLPAEPVRSPFVPRARPVRRPPATRCTVCAGTRLHYLFSVQHYRLVRCEQCGLILTDPQPTDAELAAIYGEDYFLVEKNEAGRNHVDQLKQRTAGLYLDLLESYGVPANARFLEIGSGLGDLLLQAQERGMDVTGVEYSASACEIARGKVGDRGRVVQGEIDALDDETGLYDVCALSDLIEHVRDPRDLLERVHRLLKPGGVILIATPTLDSWSARLLRNRWMEFKPEHLFYFNSATLQTLLFETHFTGVVERPCVKALSLDYIAGHFARYPVPGISTLTRLVRRVLPQSWRRKPLDVVASGVLMLARSEPARPRRKLSIVMPVYNEANTFETAFERTLAKEIEGLDIEIVVVESNSTDGTRALVEKYRDHPRVSILLEDKPRGKGHAVRAGLERADGDFVLIQDADLEYDVEDYQALLEPLRNGRAAFVLGARHGGSTWKIRSFTDQRVLSGLLNLGHGFFALLINVLFNARLKDPFTMYKVFRRDCLHGLRFRCNRFDFDHEIVVKFLRKGYRPLEIPVNYRSRSFKEGKKVTLFRDPLTWLKTLAVCRLERLDPLEEVSRLRSGATHPSLRTSA